MNGVTELKILVRGPEKRGPTDLLAEAIRKPANTRIKHVQRKVIILMVIFFILDAERSIHRIAFGSSGSLTFRMRPWKILP
jgi:hypothetical protein